MPLRPGRKRNNIRPVVRKLSLPSDLVAEVELLLMDPISGRPRYGAWSQLVTALLSDWLEAQRKEPDHDQ